MNVWSLIQLAYFIESGTFVGSLLCRFKFLNCVLKNDRLAFAYKLECLFYGARSDFFLRFCSNTHIYNAICPVVFLRDICIKAVYTSLGMIGRGTFYGK